MQRSALPRCAADPGSIALPWPRLCGAAHRTMPRN